jgi:hypothetical protein
MTKLRFRSFGNRLFRYASVARAAWLLILLSANFSSAAAQAPQSMLPFARGEELVYQAEFTRGLLRGIDVAEFHFQARSEHVSKGAEDPVILRLTGDVVSKGLFPKIAGFKFHQHVESIAQPVPFAVLHTDKIDEQGKRSRVLEALFNHETHKATWTERNPNPGSVIIDFSEPIQDVLTVIYFLRTQKLEVGKSFDVPLSDAGRLYRFSVKAVERKQLNTVLGRVNAIRVEPALFGDAGVVRARGLLSIWVTDDERRLPVRAQLKVDIGTFDIKLKRLSYPQPK